MSRSACLVLLALLASRAVHAQQLPADVPAAGPVTAMKLPRPQEEVLPNGLRLVVYEDHRAPVVSITLGLKAGNAYDPVRKEGLSDLLASLLTRGAGQRTADSVAALVERSGASFGVVSGADHLTLQFDTPSSEAATAFSLMADAIQRPALDSAEFEARKIERLEAVTASLEDDQALAGRVFFLATYADHPYGRRPTHASILDLTREDLRAYLAARVRPAGAVLVVAGDIRFADAARLARQAFGSWKGAKPPGLPPAGPRRVAAGIVLVHLPGAMEATVLVGGPALEGADSGHYAAAVLARLLNDPAAGRLARRFTGQPGLPGETGASFSRTAGAGFIQLSATVPVENTDSAIQAIRQVAAELRTGAIGESEMTRAREYVAGAFALRLQTAGQIAGAQTEARLLGLPPAYLAGFRPRVMAVTAKEVRAIASRVLPDSGQVTVVAGDAVKLHPRLAKLGPVQLVSADGRRLDVAAIQPRSMAFTVDMRRFSPRIDSLAIVAEGRVLGGQMITVRRDADSLQYRDESVFGEATRQVTTATLDTLGRVRQVEQAGASREGATGVSLRYDAGRVTGRAEFPGPGGQSVVNIDQSVPADVIDESALTALLPLLAWELNNQWALKVFSARENRIQPMTLTVSDIVAVRVPAGDFECFRGDLEGGPQRISFFVTRAAPYRVVRIEIANTPVELVAINR